MQTEPATGKRQRKSSPEWAVQHRFYHSEASKAASKLIVATIGEKLPAGMVMTEDSAIQLALTAYARELSEPPQPKPAADSPAVKAPKAK